MSNTASNQGEVIATKGTPHVARTNGATDAGIDPATKTTASFNNEVSSALLTPGTSNTLIANQKIWTAPHQLGPPSKDPHPPYVIGTESGTHIMEAKATTYSQNVLAENNGVVRTNDKTTQNHANTKGSVDGSALTGSNAATTGFLQKQCTIVELTGLNGKRPLGYPGLWQAKPPYYIEILSTKTVVFKATRKDVTPGAGSINPKCWKADKHTDWWARRTGIDAAMEDHVEGKDEYEIPKSLTTLALDTLDSLKGDGAPKVAKDAWGKINKVEGTKTTEQFAQNTPERASKKNREKAKDEKVDATLTTTTNTVDGIADSLEALIAFIAYWIKPTIINVEALSCGGSRNATIKVFPSQKINLTLILESEKLHYQNSTQRQGKGRRALNQAIAALTKMKDTANIAQKIMRLAGSDMAIDFLKSTQLNLTAGYEECTEEKEGFFGNLYTPAHIGFAWKLTFTASVLIGFSIEYPIPLANVINFIAPGLGSLAARILKKVNIRADFVLIAKLSVPLNVSLGMDKYQYLTNTGVEIGVKPTLGFGLRFYAGIKILSFDCTFPGSLTVGLYGGDKPGVWMQLQPKGSLKTCTVTKLFEDSWWGKSVPYDPPSWVLTWTGPRIDVLSFN